MNFDQDNITLGIKFIGSLGINGRIAYSYDFDHQNGELNSASGYVLSAGVEELIYEKSSYVPYSQITKLVVVNEDTLSHEVNVYQSEVLIYNGDLASGASLNYNIATGFVILSADGTIYNSVASGASTLAKQNEIITGLASGSYKISSLGKHTTADPSLNDGDVSFLRLNKRGELLIFNKPGKVSGTFTNVGGVGQTLELDVEGWSTMVVQTVSSSWTGSALTLQATVNGTNWITIAGTNINAFFNVNSGVQSQTISAGTSGIFRCNVSGYCKVRLTNLGAISAGSVAVSMVGTNSTSSNVVIEGGNSASSLVNVGLQGTGSAFLQKAEDSVAASGDIGVFVLGVRQDTLLIPTSLNGDYSQFSLTRYGGLICKKENEIKGAYSASLVLASLPAAATDIFVVQGQTKNLEIKSITMVGVSENATYIDVSILKRSTNDSVGTTTIAVPHDGADAAPTGRIHTYASNPTLGTLVGAIDTFPLTIKDGVLSPCVVYHREYGDDTKPIVLRANTQDTLAVNINNASLTDTTIYITIIFTEV